MEFKMNIIKYLVMGDDNHGGWNGLRSGIFIPRWFNIKILFEYVVGAL